jgi:hypothetical protein
VVNGLLILGEAGILAANSLVVVLVRHCGVGSALSLFFILGVVLIAVLTAAFALVEFEKSRARRWVGTSASDSLEAAVRAGRGEAS